MALFKPEVRVTLFPKKAKTSETTEDTALPIDLTAAIADAEAAAGRLGKKVVLGASVVSVVTVAAATLGSIAIIAVNHSLNK